MVRKRAPDEATSSLFDDTPFEQSEPGLSPVQQRSNKGKPSVLHQPMQSIAIRPVDRGSLTKGDLLLWLKIIQEIQQMTPARSYSLPMRPLMIFMNNERRYDRIKTQLRALNRTQVEWNNSTGKDKEVWGVSTLISQAEIIKDGGTIMLEIELPGTVDKGVRELTQFSAINLLLARELHSTAALNLYRIAVAYETNPSHLTFKRTVSEWDEILRGASRDPTKELVYKYMKRDLLQPAIEELKQMTHLDVELIEHRERGGRAVTHLQFIVKAKAQPVVKTVDPADLLAKSALKSMGLRAAEIPAIVDQYGAERIMRNVEYTQAELAKGTVRTPRAYLKRAIIDDYAQQGEVIDAKPPKAKKEKPNMADVALGRFKAWRLEEAEKIFMEMTRKQSEAEWNEFANLDGKAATLVRAVKAKGLSSPLVKQAFFDWMATKTWGPVNNDTLIAFMREHPDQLQ
jgi:hypothetical protein